jgi:hypothetical protein
MSRPRLVPVGIAAIVVSLALAGCSADADSGSGSGSELSFEDSPLNEYMAAVYDAQEDVDYEQQQKETEELIAACMADEGFEYIPVDYSAQYEEMDEQDIEDQNTEEWVAENGYGMNQTPEQAAEANEQATEFVDPNQDYVSTLSESEQMAFYEVLYGPTPDDSELDEDGSYEYNWEEAGCSGAAQHETGGDSMWDDPAHKNVTDAMNDLWTDLESSPAMTKLNSDWASCMADAGHPDFAVKNDAMNAVMDEQNALWEGSETGPTEEETAAARDNELKIALADFRCAEEVDYMDKSLEAQFALEEQFISDYKAELDALIADYETGA